MLHTMAAHKSSATQSSLDRVMVQLTPKTLLSATVDFLLQSTQDLALFQASDSQLLLTTYSGVSQSGRQ